MSQVYDYIFVLDFEATCCNTDSEFTNEIIEFPIVVVDVKTGKIIAEFQEYVRPTVNPTLTDFCTSLTGIQQETVDKADTFEVVYERAYGFCQHFHEQRGNPQTVFLTCGNWDLQKMLPNQVNLCKDKMPRIPNFFQKWINVKVPFREIERKKRGGMTTMLKALNLPLVGRHHSGLDDSRNIAAIVAELIKRGVILKQTGEWSEENKRQLGEE